MSRNSRQQEQDKNTINNCFTIYYNHKHNNVNNKLNRLILLFNEQECILVWM